MLSAPEIKVTRSKYYDTHLSHLGPAWPPRTPPSVFTWVAAPFPTASMLRQCVGCAYSLWTAPPPADFQSPQLWALLPLPPMCALAHWCNMHSVIFPGWPHDGWPCSSVPWGLRKQPAWAPHNLSLWLRCPEDRALMMSTETQLLSFTVCCVWCKEWKAIHAKQAQN